MQIVAGSKPVLKSWYFQLLLTSVLAASLLVLSVSQAQLAYVVSLAFEGFSALRTPVLQEKRWS